MKKTLLIVVAIASFISTVAQQKTDSSDKSPKAKASEAILFLIPIKVSLQNILQPLKVKYRT
jgi:hypothetical protein